MTCETTMRKAVLCIDSESVQHPGELGLFDESFEAQDWLLVYSSADEARAVLRNRNDVGDVWVVSSDSMDGINLAAALRYDHIPCPVKLVSFSATGSVVGRCSEAGIQLIHGQNAFVKEYSAGKARYLQYAQLASKQHQRFTLNATEHAVFSNDAALKETSDNETTACAAAEQPPIEKGVVSTSKHVAKPEGVPAAVLVPESVPEPAGERKADRQSESPATPAGNKYCSGGAAASTSSITTLPIEEPALDSSALEDKPSAVLVPPRSAGHPNKTSTALPKESPEQRIAYTVLPRATTASDAFVVAVVSGAGGVGKSAIAAGCAVASQMMGNKTLLLDADLQFGDMEYLMGKDDAFDVAELLSNPERITQIEPEGFLPAVLASPKRLELSELIVERTGELIEYLKGYFDVIVINTGSFWSEQHAQILEVADRTLFILDQRPSSIRGCNHALDLCARCGIATQSFSFVLNFCSRHALFTSIDVSCALHGVQVQELKDGGRDVAELLGAGLPYELLSSKNAFAEGIRLLCLDFPRGRASTETSDTTSQAARKRKRFFGARRGQAACL